MEQRSETRQRVDTKVLCQAGDKAWQQDLRDISVGGCKLSGVRHPIAAGSVLDVTLLTGVEVSGIVRWASDGDVGVEFNEPLPSVAISFLAYTPGANIQRSATYDAFGRKLPPLGRGHEPGQAFG